MNKKFFVILLCLSVVTLVMADDPLETTSPEETQGISKLYKTICGTTWIHHYKGGNFSFTFGTNGVIENHKTWQGTPWRVVSSKEVILGKKETRGKMIFTFDRNIKNFVNLNWDGTPTSGTVSGSNQ
jgi:hypothetical protein